MKKKELSLLILALLLLIYPFYILIENGIGSMRGNRMLREWGIYKEYPVSFPCNKNWRRLDDNENILQIKELKIEDAISRLDKKLFSLLQRNEVSEFIQDKSEMARLQFNHYIVRSLSVPEGFDRINYSVKISDDGFLWMIIDPIMVPNIEKHIMKRPVVVRTKVNIIGLYVVLKANRVTVENL